MSDHEATPSSSAVRKVMVATDRSETANRAVRWAADLAQRCDSDLLLVQVLGTDTARDSDGGPDVTMSARLAERDLSAYANELAGSRGLARVVVDDDPAGALVRVAEEAGADTLVVGNVGMSGRKRFLLENIPNRISHNAACNVVIVNTTVDGADVPHHRRAEPESSLSDEPHLIRRAAQVGKVMARHGIDELFSKHEDTEALRIKAQHLREALEELGPTFEKLGQILSTRPDLLPAPFIEELSRLQDDVPPLSEAEVVAVMEQELGVPWEDVFESIEPDPLAAGTIAQVHRARLDNGDGVVLKVQRPNARAEIMEDLALLELFAEKTRNRPLFRQIIDMEAVFEHLSDSLQRELDFLREASNAKRLGQILEPYPRLAVPEIYDELTSTRLLVMEEIPGSSVRLVPEGEPRREAARQLLEAYYAQILTDGFFHADPHPGNLLWWDDRLYFLDFGMVGEIGPDLRQNMMLLLLAFWQEDVGFLMDVTLALSGGPERSEFDADRFRAELGDLLTRYRNVSLRDIQLGPILQEMTEIAIRYDVPLPASLTLTSKAMAQMQLTAAELDPDLDPFEVAGDFLMRSMTARVKEKIDPKWLFYESQKLRTRVIRLVEALERLTGARPGHKLEVNFRAERLERVVTRAGRQLSLGATTAAMAATATRLARDERVPAGLPVILGALGSALAIRLLVDVSRKGP